mgnify:CR=1 FL=1
MKRPSHAPIAASPPIQNRRADLVAARRRLAVLEAQGDRASLVALKLARSHLRRAERALQSALADPRPAPAPSLRRKIQPGSHPDACGGVRILEENRA